MMKSQPLGICSPEVESLISEIVKEDNRYVLTEMRSMHRENLVVPVTMIFNDGRRQDTFSRNISGVGICLIGPEPVDEGEIVDLEIYRLNGQPSQITADSRWCKPFGNDFYMSGWKFVRVRRPERRRFGSE